MLAACGRIGFASEASSSSTDGSIDGTTDGNNNGGDGSTATGWVDFAPAPGTVHDLWGLLAFGADDVWVSGNQGTILHYTGSSWTPTPSPATDSVFVLWGPAPDDIWAVSRNCLVMHWQGQAWSQQTTIPCTPTVDMFSVHGTATDNLWITGTGGRLGQFTGTWTDRSTGNEDFWDVHVESATKATIVGTKGTILRWNGSNLVPESGAPNITIAGIWGDGTNYWAVGEGGAILQRGNTGVWSSVTSPTSQFLYAIHGTAANDIWAVGTGGALIHYDGQTWSLVVLQNAMTLRNVGPIPGAGVAAVGDAGTMFEYQ
jgi:hypothetical protein